MDVFMQAAIEEAKVGLLKGGIPIDSVLVRDGQVIGRGHNRRVQQARASERTFTAFSISIFYKHV